MVPPYNIEDCRILSQVFQSETTQLSDFSHVELCEILGFRGVWCVHNPCHLGMGILYQSRRASNVVTTHVKYGDQGIYYSWLDN